MGLRISVFAQILDIADTCIAQALVHIGWQIELVMAGAPGCEEWCIAIVELFAKSLIDLVAALRDRGAQRGAACDYSGSGQ